MLGGAGEASPEPHSELPPVQSLVSVPWQQQRFTVGEGGEGKLCLQASSPKDTAVLKRKALDVDFRPGRLLLGKPCVL